MSNSLNRRQRRKEARAYGKEVQTWYAHELHRRHMESKCIELYLYGMCLALHDELNLPYEDIERAAAEFMNRVDQAHSGKLVDEMAKELKEKTGMTFTWGN